ncbi:MAG TPA: VOC family protein [Geobacterales bacterium]|nr:VOC family protein [Geobacterales bacterium]
MESLIKGLHHITLVTKNFQVNSWFYTNILGLKRVKLSVNQDDIFHRHVFYSNPNSTVGSTITFFEWPFLEEGYHGLGSPHHLSYFVESLEAIPKWKSWLKYNKVPVSEILYRNDRASLYLRDPDGVIIEISTRIEGEVDAAYISELNKLEFDVRNISSDMKLVAFDHASPITANEEVVARFFEKILGLTKGYSILNPDQENTRIVAIGNEERNDFLRYIYAENAAEGYVGIGSIHHIAMAVDDEEDQRQIMRKLSNIGIRNSGIIDRLWFKSLYFRDPNGNLLEIATRGPGYTVDEKLEELGSKLVLPPWLEKYRNEIELRLAEQDRENPSNIPPHYKSLRLPPESL